LVSDLFDAVTGGTRTLGTQVGADPGRLLIAATIKPRNGRRVDPGYVRRFEATVGALERLGHTVVEARPGARDDE
jgi:hypothetical protein